jgi:hypothetical protein
MQYSAITALRDGRLDVGHQVRRMSVTWLRDVGHLVTRIRRGKPGPLAVAICLTILGLGTQPSQTRLS